MRHDAVLMAIESELETAAVMATDVEGCGSLAAGDDQLAQELRDEYLTILRDVFARHDGRETETTGTRLLVAFESGLEAIRCAVAIQDRLRRRNSLVADERRLNVRVGIDAESLGAETTATRLSVIAPPGGICVSANVIALLTDRLDLSVEPIGMLSLEDGRAGPDAFRVRLPWGPKERATLLSRWWPWVVAMIVLTLAAVLAGVAVGLNSALRAAMH